MANFAANALIGGVTAAAGQIRANDITHQSWSNGVIPSALAGAIAGGFFGGLKGFANTPLGRGAGEFWDGLSSGFQSSLSFMLSFLGQLFGRFCWGGPQ